MKFVVIAAAVLLTAAVLFAARGLAPKPGQTTASTHTHITAHAASPVTTDQQAIADADASSPPFLKGKLSAIPGVTAQYVTPEQLDQIIGSGTPALADGTYWWAVTYPSPPEPLPNVTYAIDPNEPRWLPSPAHLTVVLDPASGAVVADIGW